MTPLIRLYQLAFKLTQQESGRPVSPINFQNPPIHGKFLRDRDLQGGEVNDSDSGSCYEIVLHEDSELQFLDFYNEKICGGSMLHSK